MINKKTPKKVTLTTKKVLFINRKETFLKETLPRFVGCENLGEVELDEVEQTISFKKIYRKEFNRVTTRIRSKKITSGRWEEKRTTSEIELTFYFDKEKS